MQVAIPLYPRMTALDAVGPYEVLQRVPEVDVVFVGAERGEVRMDNDMLGLTADATFTETPRPDVVVVPGGVGTFDLLAGSPLVDWVRSVHPTTQLTTSVCTGSIILAAAGLLTGLPATTHWAAVDVLARFGAEPIRQRIVENLEHRIITAAGVSAGIDMGIRLLALLVDDVAAQAAQVFVEYDPEPPFDAGHPDKVGTEVMARLARYRQVRS